MLEILGKTYYPSEVVLRIENARAKVRECFLSTYPVTIEEDNDGEFVLLIEYSPQGHLGKPLLFLLQYIPAMTVYIPDYGSIPLIYSQDFKSFVRADN